MPNKSKSGGPHGGARDGAGRPWIVLTPMYDFVIAEFLQRADAAQKAKQTKFAIAAHPEYGDVFELHSQLRAQSSLESEGGKQILKDIRYHFLEDRDDDAPELNQELNDGPNLPRRIPSVPLSSRDRGKIYAAIVKAAPAKFGRPISLRQVKRCVDAHRQLRADFKAHLEKRCS